MSLRAAFTHATETLLFPKNFLEKYCSKPVPCRLQLRRGCRSFPCSFFACCMDNIPFHWRIGVGFGSSRISFSSYHQSCYVLRYPALSNSPRISEIPNALTAILAWHFKQNKHGQRRNLGYKLSLRCDCPRICLAEEPPPLSIRHFAVSKCLLVNASSFACPHHVLWRHGGWCSRHFHWTMQARRQGRAIFFVSCNFLDSG